MPNRWDRYRFVAGLVRQFPSRRSDIIFAWWLFTGICSIYLLTAGGHGYNSDNAAKLRVAESLFHDHDVAVDPEEDYGIQGKDGRYYIFYPIGSSLLYLPAVLLGDFMGGFVHSVPKGFLIERLVSILNVFVTAGTGVVLWATLRLLGYSRRGSTLTTLLYAFGTMAFPYAQTDWSEPPAGALLFVAFFFLLRFRENPRDLHVLLGGLCLGLASTFRLEMMVLMPVGAGAILWITQGELKQKGQLQRFHAFRPLALFVISYAVGWMPNGLYNYVRFGEWLNFGYRGIYPFHHPQAALPQTPTFRPMVQWLDKVGTQLYGYLFSPGKGLLLFSPPVILLGWSWRRFGEEPKTPALIGLAFPLTLMASLAVKGTWSGLWAWGERLLVPVIPFLILPTVALLESRKQGSSRVPKVWFVCFGLGLLVQLLGVTVNFHVVFEKMLDRGVILKHNEIRFQPRYCPLLLHLRELGEELVGTRLLWQWRKQGEDALRRYETIKPTLDEHERAETAFIRKNTLDFWWLLTYFYGIPGPLVAMAFLLLIAIAFFSWRQIYRSIADQSGFPSVNCSPYPRVTDREEAHKDE